MNIVCIFFFIRFDVCIKFGFDGHLPNQSIMIVLTVNANNLTILCNGGNVALVALIFRTIPGSSKLIQYFYLKLMAFYDPSFFVFARNSKLKVGSYHAHFKMQ